MQHPLFRYIVIYGHTHYSCNVVFFLISFMRNVNTCSSILQLNWIGQCCNKQSFWKSRK